MNKNKNLAFTLAEVLIVIGIIGVVAALTLPNLNHATGDKEKVTKAMKIYSTLTEAVDRAQAIYGASYTWFKDLDCNQSDRVVCNERFAKRVTEFMKVSKDCGFGEGCFSSAPLLSPDGSEYNDSYLADLQSYKTYMVMLPDHVSLGFRISEGYYRVRVDIDGPNKGKNQEGNDIFDFYISDSIEPGGGLRTDDDYLESFDFISSIDSYAMSWVIRFGNLDYLKCPEELNWSTKTSCE